MSLDTRIITELQRKPGQKARELSATLKADARDINSALYGRLNSQVRQDRQYRWWPADAPRTGADTPAEEPGFANTPLARLARYYLACLGQDDTSEISVWARSHYTPDYAPLSSLPGDDFQALLQEPGPMELLKAMHRDRNTKVMYLGYPIVINRFNARSGKVIHRLEPVFLLPVQFEQPNNRGLATVAADYPILNTAILKRFSNADEQTLMIELLSLEAELGFSETGEIPELEDIAQRLQSIRSEWPWLEDCDPEQLPLSPAIEQLDEPGIYNRAVLLTAERKPYTQGLESELRDLAKLKAEDYQNTALGALVNNTVNDAQVSSSDNPLLEVLPMNLEQETAVSQSLTHPLTIITGPPGTGKSQVVTNLLINAAWQGKKVLFASKNNKAVDVVEVRINNLGPRPLLLRMGSNAYQMKLKESLQALLAASTTPHDYMGYNEALETHNRLLEESKQQEALQDQLIELRNLVDTREKEVEDYREQLGISLFAQAAKIIPESLKGSCEDLIGHIQAADRERQGFVTRLFWPLIKNARYAALNDSIKTLKKECPLLLQEAPVVNPGESSMIQWRHFSKPLNSHLKGMLAVYHYFAALQKLLKTPSLETISRNLESLKVQISDNSEKLWTHWLKLAPSRLQHEDRQLLAQYVSILQMITANEQGRLQSSVWRQYYVLTEKVSHLLPCWAVTSLSARGKIPLVAGFFDLVVFDEASQCDIASALPLLYRAKQVVVIGDPRQLSHISSIHRRQDTQLLERYDLQLNYLQWAYSFNSLYDMTSSYAKSEDIVTLRDHHRSHADIINFSNRHFYDGSLRVATRYDNLKRLSRSSPGVRWVDVKGRTVRPNTGSAQNQREAEAVVYVLNKLVVEQGYKGSIGVVSPFRAQANLIKDLCSKNSELYDHLLNLDFMSTAVHSFQGDERDLMVFSPVISEDAPASSIRFLQNTGNLFNVAITRARAMLIVVGDRLAAKGSGIDYLSSFADYVDTLDSEQATQEAEQITDFGPQYPGHIDRSTVSDWEILLYEALYKAGIVSLPQYPVEQYRLDLAIITGDSRLDIEVDGERYHRNWTGELCRRDQIRNQRMYELGWDVMRFWVYEIRDNLDGCLTKIKDWIEAQNNEQI